MEKTPCSGVHCPPGGHTHTHTHTHTHRWRNGRNSLAPPRFFSPNPQGSRDPQCHGYGSRCNLWCAQAETSPFPHLSVIHVALYPTYLLCPLNHLIHPKQPILPPTVHEWGPWKYFFLLFWTQSLCVLINFSTTKTQPQPLVFWDRFSLCSSGCPWTLLVSLSLLGAGITGISHRAHLKTLL
jgi:hypothetical protein